LATGINEINLAASVSIYPNPVSDQFSIDINSLGTFNVELFDIKGSRVFKGLM